MDGIETCSIKRPLNIDLNQAVDVVEDGTISYKVPFVGQVFDDEHISYSFYLEYAYVMGFGIKMYSLKKSKKHNGRVIWRSCCCSKQGVKDQLYGKKIISEGGEITRNFGDVKIGYVAYMNIVYVPSLDVCRYSKV